jgi:hypothetical protein
MEVEIEHAGSKRGSVEEGRRVMEDQENGKKNLPGKEGWEGAKRGRWGR